MSDLWIIHQDRDEDDPELESYTIALNNKKGGWNTDNGCNGYGLPKDLALWICKVLNESKFKCPYKMDEYGSWTRKE